MSAPPESAEVAFRTSAYSFKALAETVAPLMDGGGSLVGMDFDATVAWPVYDWMGVAKAALESVSRYLARDLGLVGRAGQPGLRGAGGHAGGRRHPGLRSVGCRCGKSRHPWGGTRVIPRPWPMPCSFLLSDWSRAVSGEILHVDGGFHAMGAPLRGS